MLKTGRDARKALKVISDAQALVKAKVCAFFIPKRILRSKTSILALRHIGAMIAIAFVFVPLSAVIGVLSPESSAQSSTLNFQGRLLTNTGSLVADGDYNIEFKIYDSAAAGASAQGVCVGGGTDDCLWVETRTGGNQVSIQNGYYSVYLGDITSLPDIDWSQDLWVTMNIGGTGAPSWDGEMSPRFRLTSVPRALSAEELSVTDSGNTTTIQIATPTSDNTITAPDDSGTLCLTSGNCAGVGGTGDILDGGQTGAISVGTTNNTTLTLLQNGSAAITLNSSQLLQFNAYNCSTFTNGGTLTTDASGNVVCANDDGGAGASTLQASYDADTNGSDVRIDLTTADDSLIFSNPSSGGSNSEFVLTVEQLATGASTSGLQIISNGTSGSYALRVNDDGTDSDSTPFVVENTGDVGIGTASPSRPLDVQRDATDTDGGAIARFEGDLTYEAASSTENQYGVRAAITLDLDSAAASGSTYYGIGSNLTVVDGNLSNGTAVATNSFASKSSGGTLGNAVGGRFYVFNQSTGTIQNAYGLSVVDALNSSGTIQDQAGIAIANQTGTGDRTNLLIGTINIPDGADYSIYNASGYQNYFASGLRFGADSTDNLIDNLSNGSGSATLYIGNQAIVVNSDIAGFDTTDDTVSGTVDTSEIQNDTITEPDLDLTNTPTDNYILTYNSGGANFTWVDPTTVGTTPTLQVAYDNGNTLTTSNNRDLTVTLANTATDSDFVINVASGSTSEFAVQNNGTNQLVINSGGIDLLDVDTADFTGATVTFDAGEIDEAEIAQNSLDDSEIQNNSLTSLSLANDSVQSAEIDDNTIQEVDLEATNSATDDYVLTYDSGSGGFTWVSQAAVSGTAGVTSLNTLDGDLSIVGNTQIGVSPSGSNINLSVQADSIGDAQLEYNTGQNLTTSSTPRFADLQVYDNSTGSDTLTIGEASAQGDNGNDGLIVIRGEQGGAVGSTSLINTGTNFQITSSDTEIQLSPTNLVEVLSGKIFRLRDSTNTDTVSFQHDGTDFNITGTNTTAINFVAVDVEIAGDITVTGANLILGSTDLSEADLDALDNGTITLGTETTGAYDSTPDTIADDGAIQGSEITNETVTNADIDDGTVRTNEITDNTILEADLNVTNAPTDNYILSFNNASGNFTWVVDDTGTDTTYSAGTGIDLSGTTFSVSAAGGLSTTATGLTTTGILQDLNTLGSAASDGQFIVATGAGTFAYESGATALTSLGGANTALSNLSSVSLNASLFVDTDNTYDLGTSSVEFRNAYFDGTVRADTLRSDADTLVVGGDIYDSGGQFAFRAEDSAIIAIDYNNNDADTQSFYVVKNDGLGTAPTNILLQVLETGNATLLGDLTVTGANLILGSTNLSEADLDALDDGVISNAELSNSSLTVTAGNGLANGGSVALGASTTLNVGAGTCITSNANDVAVTNNCTDATSVDGIDGTNIVTLSGSQTLTGAKTFSAAPTVNIANGTNFTFTDGTDNLVVSETAGDYSILNTQQDNGIVIYDGTAGVEIWYNGSAAITTNSTVTSLAQSVININTGVLRTANVTRLTNAGVLQNITGITSSGTISFTGLGTSSTEDTIVTLNGSNQLVTREYSDFLSDNSILNGTGSAGRVAYWSDADTLTNSANLTFNGSTLGAAALSITGDSTFDGGEVTINYDSPSYGVSIEAATVGGWARSYNFLNDSDVILGGFGGYGTTDALTYLYLDDGYSGAAFKVSPSTDIVSIGYSGSSQGTNTLDVNGTFRATGNVFLNEDVNLGDAVGDLATVTGNLRVGTGSTPGLTLNGDDLFVEGTAEIDGQLRVDAQINANGVTNLNGNVNLGNAAADTITFSGEVDSNIIPDTDDAYDLGSSTNRWRDLYLGPASLNIGNNSTNGVLSFDTVNNEFDLNRSVQVNTAVTNDSRISINETGDTAAGHYAGVDFQDNGTYAGGIYKNGLNDIKILTGGFGEAVSIDNGDADVNITSDLYVFGGNILFPTANSYLNFSGTAGSGGYGIRDNGGTIEVKNSGGGWAAIGAGAWTSSGGYTTLNTPADNVGIGISTPDEKLYVQGSSFTYAKVESTTANSAGIKFENTVREWSVSNNTSTGDFTVNDITGGRTPLTIQDGALSNSLYVNSSSNVGIGTNAPATKLEVSNSTGNVGITIDAPTGSYAMQYFAINGVNEWHYEATPSGGSFGVVESGVAQRLTLESGGDVGVGVAAPDGFQVNVAVSETAQGTDNVRLGVSGGTARLLLEDNGGTQWQIDNSSGTMRFFQPGTVYASLGATGTFNLTQTTDASLANDGLLVLGPTNGVNLAVDGNELVARNNGAASTLNLNITGGNLVLGAVSTSETTTIRNNVSIPTADGSLSFGSDVRQMINLWSTSYGIGVQSSTQYYRSGSNFAWYTGGSHNDSALNNGGGTTLMYLRSSDLTVTPSIVSNVAVNDNILQWSTTGALRRESNQGGITLYSDSYQIYHAGDAGPTIAGTLGLTDAASTENIYLTADAHVNVVTDLQDAGTFQWQFQNDGDFDLPQNGDILMDFGGTISGTGDIFGIDYTNAGRFGIGYTNNGAGVLRLGHAATQTVTHITTSTSGQTTGTINVMSIYENGSLRGTILVTGGNVTQYNTSSDYRLKENVSSLNGQSSLDAIRGLRPVEYNFIEAPDSERVSGFIAHEAQQFVPDAITGNKDELNDDGTIKAQQINLSMLVPTLIAGFKELDVQVQNINTRLSVIESGNFDFELNVSENVWVAKNLTVGGTTTLENVEINGKIITAGDVPTAVNGAVLAATDEVEIDGNDTAGTLTITFDVSSTPVDGELAEVTFDQEYDEVPRIALTPLNGDALDLPVFIEKTTEGFKLITNTTPQADTTYEYDYIIIQ